MDILYLFWAIGLIAGGFIIIYHIAGWLFK